jgi:hypothetical protein
MFGELYYRDRKYSGLRPNSKFRYLVEQVDDQSPLCDFTVKVGLWVNKVIHTVFINRINSVIN